jgi:hypothetical protein
VKYACLFFGKNRWSWHLIKKQVAKDSKGQSLILSS